MGTAIYYNIFNSNIKTKLPTYISQAAIQAGLPEGSAMAFVEAITSPLDPAGMAAKVQGVTPAIIEAGAMAAHWAFADSLRYVWYATIPFGIICMICCAFLPNIRQYMTNRLAVVSTFHSYPFKADDTAGHSLSVPFVASTSDHFDALKRGDLALSAIRASMNHRWSIVYAIICDRLELEALVVVESSFFIVPKPRK